MCSHVVGSAWFVVVRWRRQTVIVKLSQPFVCQLFLAGCILLNITASLHVEMALYAACVVRPWVMHIGLTFTSGCVCVCTTGVCARMTVCLSYGVCRCVPFVWDGGASRTTIGATSFLG